MARISSRPSKQFPRSVIFSPGLYTMSTWKHIQIVSGSPNVEFVAPNKFRFKMPSPYKSGNYDRVSMKSLRLYYSWFNLTQAKNNNRLSYRWIDNSEHEVVWKDGIWDFEVFQQYLEQVMMSKGHYLLNDKGSPVYFIQLEANSVFYRISLTVRPVPAVMPIGWVPPPGFVTPPRDKTPQLIIPSTKIADYLGLQPGSYPATWQSTIFQTNGQLAPQVTDSSSLMLLCNLVSNEYGPDSRALATFTVTPGTDPGAMISEVPFYQDWIPVQPCSNFSTILLELVDQNANPVKLEDPAGFICTINLDSRPN